MTEIKMLHDVEVDGDVYADNITDMEDRITALEEASESGVINNLMFIDYDGSVIKSYDATQAAALTALPNGPTHDGMTFQEWNWTLSEITTLFGSSSTAHITVGALYTSSSTATEITLNITRADQYTIYFNHIAVNGTISINWGDDTSETTHTGTSLTSSISGITHTYTATGTYTISISAISGSWTFYCSSSSYWFASNTYYLSGDDYPQNPHARSISRVSIGTNSGITTIGDNAFSYYSAEVILSSAITEIGDDMLGYYYSEGCAIAISSSVQTIGDHYGAEYCRVYPCILPRNVTLGKFTSSCGAEYICMPRSITYTGGSSYVLMRDAKARIIYYPVGYTPSSSTYLFTRYNYITEYLTLSDTSTSSSVSGMDIFDSLFNLKGITLLGVNAAIFSPGSSYYIMDLMINTCYMDLSTLTSVPSLYSASRFANKSNKCYIVVADSMYNSFRSATYWSDAKIIWRIIKKSEMSQYIY